MAFIHRHSSILRLYLSSAWGTLHDKYEVPKNQTVSMDIYHLSSTPMPELQ